GSEVCDRPEVKCVFAGSGYNRVMGARFTASGADAIVGRVVARLDTLGIDALWYVGSTAAPGLGAVLERHGFVYRSEWKSMSLDLTAFSSGSGLPAGLEIREAESNKDLDAWAEIVVASYGLGDDVHRNYGRHLIARGNANFKRHHFLGLLDDRPVATILFFEGKEAAGIYWVGTLPEARHRGIAGAMTCHALREAKKAGYGRATLNASAAGHPLYLRIGFADYHTAGIYHRKGR
ncbi:MAG TPA: GNAT family N-acetyltransferase, partial [Methanocella sp.]